MHVSIESRVLVNLWKYIAPQIVDDVDIYMSGLVNQRDTLFRRSWFHDPRVAATRPNENAALGTHNTAPIK